MPKKAVSQKYYLIGVSPASNHNAKIKKCVIYDVISSMFFFHIDGVKKNNRDQDFILKVGRRIVEIRKQKSLTQEEVAKRSGLELKQIWRVESGEVNTTINTIAVIAKALEVKPRDLMPD